MIEAHDTLSNRNYALLCELVYQTAGIRLGAEKKTMLEVRIRRRVRALGCACFADYCERLFSRQGTRDELVHFIDVVTTNKTDFFREPAHFDFLTSRVLGEFAARERGSRPMMLWSAGCSSGEEPYTLAMVLSEYAAAHPGFAFTVLATDISTVVLDRAVKGIYPASTVEPVPPDLRRKYLLRSRDRGVGEVRIVPQLRRLIEFRRLNFMDEDYGLGQKADAIFCRNVIIYFDRPTQERILRRIVRWLLPGGYLFVGHSETLHDMDLPLSPVGPALYRKAGDGF